MSTTKQVTQIKMGAYIYNGSYREFADYPASFKMWNIDVGYVSDFIGSATDQTLTGRERGGVMGYRAKAVINLNNAIPADAALIRALLNKFQSYYSRLFFPASGNATSGTISTGAVTVTLPGSASAVSNFYTGLTLFNVTRNQSRRINAYSTGRVATLDGSISGWVTGDEIQVYTPPAYPTILGVSPDDDTANIAYYNLVTSNYEISRDLTIGRQVIQLEGRGVELTETIPDSVRIA